MGAVEVLRPHDPLQKRFSYRESSFVNSAMKSKRNSLSNPNPNPNPKPGRGFSKSDRRKRSPQKITGNGGVRFSSSPPPANGGGFTMGQVKILKRGEALSNTTSLTEELNKKKSDSVSRLGRELESKEEFKKKIVEKSDSVSRLGQHGIKTTPKFNIADFYAGSACDSSPPPSSLPVPGFFKKKDILFGINDDATCDLRRLLRLDLS